MDNIPAGLKEVWCWKIVEIESNFIKTLFHGKKEHSRGDVYLANWLFIS